MSGRRLFACRLLPLLPLLGGEQSHSQAEKVQVYGSGSTWSMIDEDEFTDVVPEETLAEVEAGQDACADCRGGSPAIPSPSPRTDTEPTGQQATNSDISTDETSPAGQGGAALGPAVPSSTQSQHQAPPGPSTGTTHHQHQLPSSSTKDPAPGPSTRTKHQDQAPAPSTKHQAPSTKHPAPSTKHPAPVPSTQHQDQAPGPSTRNKTQQRSRHSAISWDNGDDNDHQWVWVIGPWAFDLPVEQQSASEGDTLTRPRVTACRAGRDIVQVNAPMGG
eukprot:g2982.t1